ncbi:CATRA system-associated protein [Micromonospora gifhornensis]|uniref:CATRA system-associated protein n=1 Tax=Micromonospora gifhornensis TaxID=84594 RepID=UPI003D713151
MPHQSPAAPEAGAAGQPDAVQQAREVLADLFEWELPAERWSTVEAHLAVVEAAVADRDLVALDEAVAALELCGPDRVQRISSPPDQSAPQTVRERLGRTVDALTAAYPPAEAAPPKPPRR